MDAMIPSAFEPSTPLLESFACPGPPRRCTMSGIGSRVRMKSDENQSLTDKIRAGDAAALDGLLRVYIERSLSWINYHLPSGVRRRVDPEDVLQEACLDAFQNLNPYDGSRPIFAWLKAIAANSLRKALAREERRKRDFRTEIDCGPDSAAQQSARPYHPAFSFHELETPELVDEVSQAIRLLPPRQREAMLLVRMRGACVAQAAEILDSSQNAISCSLFQALRSLLRIIVDDPDQFPYLTEMVLPRLLKILSAGHQDEGTVEELDWDLY